MLLAPFTSDQRAEQRQMVEVNLLGAITATEVFLDQLRDGGGDLVTISSVAGSHGPCRQRGTARRKATQPRPAGRSSPPSKATIRR
jgi:NADP-dependent 3-hydroxy acid dehydrogenase YdfG